MHKMFFLLLVVLSVLLTAISLSSENIQSDRVVECELLEDAETDEKKSDKFIVIMNTFDEHMVYRNIFVNICQEKDLFLFQKPFRPPILLHS